jgi:hypothetical protein
MVITLEIMHDCSLLDHLTTAYRLEARFEALQQTNAYLQEEEEEEEEASAKSVILRPIRCENDHDCRVDCNFLSRRE